MLVIFFVDPSGGQGEKFDYLRKGLKHISDNSDFYTDFKYDVFPKSNGDNCHRKLSDIKKKRKN